ncbi:hypothetical protein ACCS67_08785 [Rhizobium brockwellii]|uniref:hypothetical protein n=1 Tax=Rhizobium brockwellii TaxID=3019932 RepID=UPI003F9A7766
MPANISGNASATSATARKLFSPTSWVEKRLSMMRAFPMMPITGLAIACHTPSRNASCYPSRRAPRAGDLQRRETGTDRWLAAGSVITMVIPGSDEGARAFATVKASPLKARTTRSSGERVSLARPMLNPEREGPVPGTNSGGDMEMGEASRLDRWYLESSIAMDVQTS